MKITPISGEKSHVSSNSRKIYRPFKHSSILRYFTLNHDYGIKCRSFRNLPFWWTKRASIRGNQDQLVNSQEFLNSATCIATRKTNGVKHEWPWNKHVPFSVHFSTAISVIILLCLKWNSDMLNSFATRSIGHKFWENYVDKSWNIWNEQKLTILNYLLRWGCVFDRQKKSPVHKMPPWNPRFLAFVFRFFLFSVGL